MYIQTGRIGKVEYMKNEKVKDSLDEFIHDSVILESTPLETVFLTNDFSDFFAGEEKGDHFTLNDKYIIFWNNFMCWYVCLDELEACKMHPIDLYVDRDEKQSFIRRIRAGSDPNLLTIVIRQSIKSDSYMIWNIASNNEEQQFDLDLKAKVLYDQQGACYIAQDDFLIVTAQGVKLKCFELENFQKASRQLLFKYSHGIRFDSLNHNWLLFSGYISLSFSFMTLVIRGAGQQAKPEELEQPHGNALDTEEYNFIINKRTFLTCNNFVAENHDKLQEILSKLEEVDPDLLE